MKFYTYSIIDFNFKIENKTVYVGTSVNLTDKLVLHNQYNFWLVNTNDRDKVYANKKESTGTRNITKSIEGSCL